MGDKSGDSQQDSSGRYAALIQGRENRKTAIAVSKLTNPNVFTPYGSQRVRFVGKGKVPHVTQRLKPNQQELFKERETQDLGLSDLATDIGQRVQGSLGEDFDNSNFYDPGDVPTYTPGKQDFSRVTEALVAKSQPFIDRRREQVENNLLLQGHTRGGQAWNAAQDDLSEVEGNIYNNAVITANQERERETGREATEFRTRGDSYTLGEDRRTRDYSEAQFLRDLPLNDFRNVRNEDIQKDQQYPGFVGTGYDPSPIFDGFLDAQQGKRFHEQQVGERKLTI